MGEGKRGRGGREGEEDGGGRLIAGTWRTREEGEMRERDTEGRGEGREWGREGYK